MLLVHTEHGRRNMEAGPLTLVAEVRAFVADVFPSQAPLEIVNAAGVVLHDRDVLGASREVFVSAKD